MKHDYLSISNRMLDMAINLAKNYMTNITNDYIQIIKVCWKSPLCQNYKIWQKRKVVVDKNFDVHMDVFDDADVSWSGCICWRNEVR